MGTLEGFWDVLSTKLKVGTFFQLCLFSVIKLEVTSLFHQNSSSARQGNRLRRGHAQRSLKAQVWPVRLYHKDSAKGHHQLNVACLCVDQHRP